MTPNIPIDDACNPSDSPSGTLALSDLLRQHSSDNIILHPPPTNDPNDPLNWSTIRKGVNFGIVCCYVLITFVLLDITTVAYGAYIAELGWSYDTLNQFAACNCVGLAIGCALFIPLIDRYGRRPIYLVSLILQLAGVIWFAKVQHGTEMYVASFITGIGGAISETVAQVTITDLFFVHQRATMNGIFLLMQSSGAFLGPVIVGYVVKDLGWRWMWWITAIFTGVDFIVTLCLFEETKFIPTILGEDQPITPIGVPKSIPNYDTKGLDTAPVYRESVSVDPYIPLKSYRQRLALVTVTDTPIKHHYWLPIYTLFRIPAVAYVALTYGFLLCLFSVTVSTLSFYMIMPPWNFDSSSIGLLSIAPFIGMILATFIGGPTSDWLSIRFARRNNGIFEAEMRLWLAIPGSFI